jgi:hypothetical protein
LLPLLLPLLLLLLLLPLLLLLLLLPLVLLPLPLVLLPLPLPLLLLMLLPHYGSARHGGSSRIMRTSMPISTRPKPASSWGVCP